MASLEWVKDPDEDMQQAWERKLVVSNSFSEAFSEMVGLCKNFRWVSCCCVPFVFITGDQSLSVGQRWLHGEKYLVLLGIFGEERDDCCSLACCAISGLSCARPSSVKTLFEGKSM